MPKKAAIVMLQEIRIPRGSKFRVQRAFRRKYPEYECYIAKATFAAEILKGTFAAEILKSSTVVSILDGFVMFLRIRMPNHCITTR